jgi:threonyl-tRNA synthetase
MDLYHFQDEAPGAVFWHPHGYAMIRRLESLIRQWMEREGFQEVRTPQILAQSIWEKSDHWDKNRPKFYKIVERDRTLGIKPVSCPGHIQVVRRLAPGEDDLPIRLSEFGICHENDPGGDPEGLFRLCQFTVDDGHVFCREDQVLGEVAKFARSLFDFYSALGFHEIQVVLATRPPARVGDDATWDRAEAVLAEAGRAAGLRVETEPGQGTFYGPRLDFTLKDHQGRWWMCGTIQLDFLLPKRFELRYADAGRNLHAMVMLHRAMVGSLERFLGLVLEQCAGELPAWLAPEQVLVAALGESARCRAEMALRELREAGLRGRMLVCEDPEARPSPPLGVPWMLVFEPERRVRGTIRVRRRNRPDLVLEPDAVVPWMCAQAEWPTPPPR